jgi:translocation and assembly module TamB
MTEETNIGQAQPKVRRRWWWALGSLLVVLAVGAALLAWYTQTENFRAWAQRKVIASLEQTTGGRVEIRQLTFNLRALRFQAEGLVIHGLEPAGQEPLVSVGRIVVDAKVLSWFGRQLAVRSVVVEQPRVHVIIDRNGDTNIPEPKAASASASNPSQPMLDVRLDHAELRKGMLVLNDRAIPFDFSADGVEAAVSYARRSRNYDGSASIARMRLDYGKLLPLEAAGSAKFSISPNQLAVEKIEVVSGKSRIDGSGTVVDFAHPRANFQYVAETDIHETTGILRLPEFRRGSAVLHGSATYEGESFTTSGKLTFNGVEYRDAAITVPSADGGAEYSADKNTLVIPHFFARLLGGAATGSAKVVNWQNGANGPAAEEQHGSLQAKADHLSLALLAAATSTRNLPLRSLKPSGTANGTIEVKWNGTPAQAHAQFAFGAQPGAAAGSEELPVAAQVRGTYSVASRRFDITQFEAAGRSMHATATGTLANSAKLSVSASGSLQDIAQFLRAWTGQEILPVGLSGLGSFQGTVSGRLNAPAVNGHLSLTDLDVPLPLQLPAPAATVMKPVTAVAPPRAGTSRKAHYDSASADIAYTPSELNVRNGVITHGTEQITIAAAIGLVKGRFYDTDPIQAQLAARNFHIQDLAALGGYSPPVTGIVNGSADIHGTKDDPRGTAHFQLTDGTVYGAPLRSASANVTFVDQKAEFSDMVIAQDGGHITGTAEYNLQTTAFAFNFSGNNFHLAEIAQLQGKGLRTLGTLNFVARGSGTQAAPVVDADISLRDLSINGERVGNMDVTAKTTRGIMRVSARSQLAIAKLTVDGTVVMANDFPADLKVKMERVDVDPVLRMFIKTQLTGHSEASGSFHLAGPLRDPKLLAVDGNLSQFSAAIENVKLQNDGPLLFGFKDGVLRLDQFKIAGTDTTLTAHGSVEFTGSRVLDLHAGGRVNLALVQSFNADLHGSGVLIFDMRAAGTVSRPTLFGTVTAQNGTLTSINFPTGISALNGSVVFNQDRFQIRQLTGTIGGGTVDFGGFVGYGNGLSFDTTATAHDVRVRYPQGFSETVDGTLRLSGTRQSSTLSGQLTVTRFNVSPQFDMAVAIAEATQPPAPPDPTSWLNDLRLNVKVNSAPDLELNTSLAKLSGDMSLTVRGTAIRPVVLGRINITEGQVSFNGATYQIDRGDVSFSNPVKIEPVIDVAATTRVRDYDVTLGFHGPIDKLSTTYRSEPPLPTADIISLLAFGKTREESEMASAAQPTFSESASNAILGQALNAAVSNRVQRLFGVSRVKIAPDVGGVANNPNARVTIEQQVSKDFTVTYITDLTRSNQQSIQVEYNYNRNVSIIGSRDQYGIISFDVRWRQRKR